MYSTVHVHQWSACITYLLVKYEAIDLERDSRRGLRMKFSEAGNVYNNNTIIIKSLIQSNFIHVSHDSTINCLLKVHVHVYL